MLLSRTVWTRPSCEEGRLHSSYGRRVEEVPSAYQRNFEEEFDQIRNLVIERSSISSRSRLDFGWPRSKLPAAPLTYQ